MVGYSGLDSGLALPQSGHTGPKSSHALPDLGRRGITLGAALTRAAWSESGYLLLNTGDYPAMVKGSQGRVKGELYQVNPLVLHEVDVLEEVPALYRRVEICLEDGRRAMTYLFAPSPDRRWEIIASGDWRVR